MPLRTLSRQLEPLRPLYALIGDAGILRDRAIAMIVGAALPQIGLAAFNHTTFRASQTDAARAVAAARTQPMLAPRRLVVLLEVEEAKPDFIDALVAYAKAPNPDATLVVAGAGWPKSERGGSLDARIKAAVGAVGPILALGPGAVPPAAFVLDEAAARGVRMAPAEAKALVEVTGTDLGRLSMEVEKLALYVGDAGVIDADAIEEAVALLAEAAVWDLTGAIAARDARRAAVALARLTKGGEAGHRLAGMIAWQLREIALAAWCVRTGLGESAAAGRTRLRPDAIARVAREVQAGRLHDADLLHAIARVNFRLNGHKAGPDRVLEGFVFELVGA